MKIDRNLPAQADVSASYSPQSLADLRHFVESHPELSKTQRRDMSSAIRSVADYIGAPPESLPADGRQLRPQIERLHPQSLGVSKSRLDNVVGSLKRALKLASWEFPGARRRAVLSSDWAVLRDALPKKTKYVYALSGFITFCSRMSIPPDQVDDEAFRRYWAELEQNSLRKDPRQRYRKASVWWNAAARDIDGWPPQRVTEPSFQAPPKNRPLSEFPDSFKADLDRLEAHLTSPNPFGTKAQARRTSDGKRKPVRKAPYKESTAANWRAMLHRAASVLVDTGSHQPEDVTGIDVLCEAGAAEAILAHYWTEAGQQPTANTGLLAKVLKLVAESYLEADPVQLDDLAGNVADMSPEETGLTEKNYERLRQFNEDNNKLLFLDAPQKLKDRAEANGVRRKRDAVDLMIAAAIAILIHAPVRLANLTNISLNRNWRRPTADGMTVLYFGSAEVKNNADLDFPLPPEAVEIVNAYLQKARPFWLTPQDDALFPYGTKRKKQAHFGDLLTGRLHQVTGLVVNTHLFRHIAAKLYLDENPGQYRVVQYLLGHKDLNTTIKFYCGLERDAAIRAYDDTVENTHKRLKTDPATTKYGKRKKRRKRGR